AEPATSTVYQSRPPVVTTQPADIAVGRGGPATLQAAASGTPVPTVEWQHSTDAGTTWANVPGATTSPYTFSTVSSSAGLYRAVFTNSSGTATTSAAHLVFEAQPTITQQPFTQ